MASDSDVRHELLERIRTHQARVNEYVRKMRGRRELTANISIVSSAVAAVLTAGPAVAGDKFTETVQNGFDWKSDSNVYRLVCLAALAVNFVAAISTMLNKSHDPTERINIAEAGNAALEGLRADVEFGRLSIKTATAEYRQIVARILFAAANPTDDAAAHANKDESVARMRTPLTSKITCWGRRSAEVVIPGMAIVFGGFVIVFVLVGLGRGVAAAGPQVSTVPQLVLSTPQVKIGDSYSAVASGFSPGEELRFSWIGPTNGMMGVFPANSTGSTTLGKIVEKDPPGVYAITVMGLTSGRISSAGLKVLQLGS